MGPVRQGFVRASFAGARSWLVLVVVCGIGGEVIGYVDECGCDDDSGSKVLCYEECPFWYSDASVSTGVDWESSAWG